MSPSPERGGTKGGSCSLEGVNYFTSALPRPNWQAAGVFWRPRTSRECPDVKSAGRLGGPARSSGDRMRPPKAFVGSSSKGKSVATALQLELYQEAEVVIWDQGPFGLSTGTLEALVVAANEFDFAILVLTPDDVVVTGDVAANAPRDNVLFELGLFVGSLGRERTFAVAPTDDIKLPSDLAGITIARYDPTRENRRASLGPVATQIRGCIERMGRRRPERLEATLPSGCKLAVEKGSILDHETPGNAVLYPTDVFFNTTLDGEVVDRRSTLGLCVSKRMELGKIDEFNHRLDTALANKDLAIDDEEPTLPSEASCRASAYAPGSFVAFKLDDVEFVLLGLNRLSSDGVKCSAVALDDHSLAESLAAFWAGLERFPVRSKLFMPVVGSGFIGVPIKASLAHILLSFRAAERRAGRRMCEELTIVVYHDDWEDGAWISALFQGLVE